MSREHAVSPIVTGLSRRQASQDSPRVLTVCGQSGGGIWHYACLLSRALRETGIDVVLATTFPFERLEGIEKVPVWPLSVQGPRRFPLPVDLSRHIVNHANKLVRLSRLIATYRPGIVHFHDRMGQLDFVYLRLLQRAGIRVVFTAHDVRRLDGKTSWFDRARYHGANAVFVHSRTGVQELIAEGVDASKITQIVHPNYLHFCKDGDLSRDEAKRLLGIPPAARSILFFGTIAPYKGLDVLVRAFSSVSQGDPQAHLTIAGEPLEEFAPYRHLIERYGIADRVLTHLRYIPFAEFSKYFRAADVVVLPYRRIYQSGILQLAYGFERAVIVTDVGGLDEVVAEDQTGLVVRAEDPGSLASAMRRLLSDPTTAEVMGRRGRRLAETKYSWSAVAEEVGRVYQSICQKTYAPVRRPFF